MKSLWKKTAEIPSTIDECVQGSRTIGAHDELVLHGGGNSSIKDETTDISGRTLEVIHVKGSGWDMSTIEPAGFAPLRMERLRELLGIASITDSELVNELRCALLDASAPDPSIEALLHAMLPFRAVLHSHADAMVSLTNQPDPAKLVTEVFGDEVVVIPYVMPGFDLAKLCNQIWSDQAHDGTRGMVLLNHGLFTFGDTMEEAYQRHIALITRAEERLALAAPIPPTTEVQPLPAIDAVRIAKLRSEISVAAQRPMIVHRDASDRVARFVERPDLSDVALRGPATPDHVIRTKRLPLIGGDIASYVTEYTEYFERNRARSEDALALLDPTPRIILDKKLGLLSVGASAKDAGIVHDIALHTFDIIDAAEAVGTYTALGEADLFDVEYWELEQAKLRRGGAPAPLAGQVAFVTGAASGIGRGIAQHLLELGACVVGIDISPGVVTSFTGATWLGIQVDVLDADAIEAAVNRTAEQFGGLDILVVAAGVFAQSAPISTLDSKVWDRTLAINVNSVQSLFAATWPLLAHAAPYGRVVVIGSKNVAAPGPGAAAYSASKAALTQLARVAALEWAPDGIRVNMVHPDAVFDTALWTQELLEERAAKYGVSVEDYKRRNLLSTDVTTRDVAQVVGTLCMPAYQATTGAQIPVDGGNERVI